MGYRDFWLIQWLEITVHYASYSLTSAICKL